MTARPCGCLPRAVSGVDEQKHAAYHALIVEQTGLTAGPIDLEAVRASRGGYEHSPRETLLDERARASGKRASGARREAAR